MRDTESGFRNVVLINASYGLSENIVKGVVVPDEYYVFKPTLEAARNPIIQKLVGTKAYKLIYEEGSKSIKNVNVEAKDRARFCVSNEDIVTLAKWGCRIEQHYSKKRGKALAGIAHPEDRESLKSGAARINC